MKILDKAQLEQKIDNHNSVGIIGTGWIAKLLYLYLIDVLGKKQVTIYNLGNRKHLLDWNTEIRDIDFTNNINTQELFIIAEQEEEGKKIQNSLSKQGLTNVFYLSANLKNELDYVVMKIQPDMYEREVLLGRKQEIDQKESKEIKEKIEQIKSQNPFPIFESIEIETINRCNGTCSFCPVNCKDDTRIYHKMSQELFVSIITQLEEINYAGRISLFSNNEPLLV